MTKPLTSTSTQLQTVAEDPCCHKRLLRALGKGLAADTWECPKCGCEWKPRIVGELRHWEPVTYFTVYQLVHGGPRR